MVFLACLSDNSVTLLPSNLLPSTVFILAVTPVDASFYFLVRTVIYVATFLFGGACTLAWDHNADVFYLRRMSSVVCNLDESLLEFVGWF